GLGLLPVAVGLAVDVSDAAPRVRALQYAALLCAAGLAILIGTELIYLSDAFASRMNTVFKFHYNAWLLLALAGALFAWATLRNAPARRPLAALGRAAVACLVALGA